jgi:carotenoid cleavage dioxygenase-like enzyme
VTQTTNIPVPDGPMMHDFALTGNYIVLFDLPVTFSMTAASAGVQLPYTWNPAHQARVGLLPRDGHTAGVRWLEVDPCWVFHALNAYDDEDGQVVVDVVQYDGPYDVSRLSGRGPLSLDRWILDPLAGRATHRRLDDRLQEFPRVDERVVSRPHRYGYSAVIGEVSRATISPDAGEAVFVPASPTSPEDDGYVMAFVHNPDRDAADLVILAAQDFGGRPLAQIHLPARIPLGFHGSWLPDQ